MSDVLGLLVRDDRLDCAVVRRRPGRARLLAAFSVGADESLGTALRARLAELGTRPRQVHVGLPRRRAIVKRLELPAVARADLRRMVGFELSRHLPFPPTDALFDFEVLERTPGAPVRVLLVACERRLFERLEEPLRQARLAPRLLDVAVHALAVAESSRSGPDRPRMLAVLQVDGPEAELVVVRRRRLLLSRAFPLPADAPARRAALAAEVERSLGTLTAEEREELDEVVVRGDGTAAESGWAARPIRRAAGIPGLSGPIPQEPGLVAAAALALRVPARGLLRTNLLPEGLRPRPFPWLPAATGALLLLTAGLGALIPVATARRDEAALDALDRRLAELAPRVREVEELTRRVEGARRELETLRGFERDGIRPLPLLRELTELLPADVWLTNLSLDRKSIELAGFAGSASQLIPLLEGSPSLERVEFTSPVTKGRDREQFRLKAAWEASRGEPRRGDGAGSRGQTGPEGSPRGGSRPESGFPAGGGR